MTYFYGGLVIVLRYKIYNLIDVEVFVKNLFFKVSNEELLNNFVSSEENWQTRTNF